MIANGLFLVVENTVPPFFAPARRVDASVPNLLPGSWQETLADQLYYSAYKVPELPLEDHSGIGFGATVLLVVALAACAVRRGTRQVTSGAAILSGRRQLAFGLATFVALAVVLSKSAFPCARIIAAYYPLLFGSLLVFAGHGLVVRQRSWRFAAVASMLLTLIVVVCTPPRPLFPAETMLRALSEKRPNSTVLARAQRIYSVYRSRPDALAPIREALPKETGTVGLVSQGNDPQVSLWRPYFQKRVVHLLPNDSSAGAPAGGVEWVAVSDDALKYRFKMSITDWCNAYGAEVCKQFTLPVLASREDSKWYLARVRSPDKLPTALPEAALLK